jgi:hypothetical protein
MAAVARDKGDIDVLINMSQMTVSANEHPEDDRLGRSNGSIGWESRP